MKRILLSRVMMLITLSSVFGIIDFQQVQAQVMGGTEEIKWLMVGSLQQYFSNCSMEIEFGRRGKGVYLSTDQVDGLRWPADYPYQDHNVGKALWIGARNFKDPLDSTTYPYKVISLGRTATYMNSVVFPVGFSLIGRLKQPGVYVDGNVATNLATNDLNLTGGEDSLDANLPCDRMIYNVANTPLGITIYRKVLDWTQQYNDNYYIYEWVFKNTGLIDNAGGKISPVDTLHGVVFNFVYRFADANDVTAEFEGEAWGLNTINDCVGQDAAHSLSPPNNFRAIFEYYGPMSASTGVLDDIGGPDFQGGHVLHGTGFTGEMVLHADSTATDTTDAVTQPSSTQFNASDNVLMTPTASSPFAADSMTQQYQLMTMGNPAQTHAQQIGEDVNGWPTAFADTWSGAAVLGPATGGYQSQQAFGPYTIPPGDSVRIVICEAVAGISRDFNRQVAKNWWTWYNNGKSGSTPLQLPSRPPMTGTAATWSPGATTIDGDLYKNAGVFSGKDSLFQTFQRARANYNSDYNILLPPPPPDKFVVTSGDSMIRVQWSTSAESAPHFNGYRIYRAVTTPDTTFDLIGSFDKGTLPPIDPATGLRTYDDLTPERGFDYYYYIQTKDDGSTNNVEPGVPLVSSEFYTMTNKPAGLHPAWRELFSGTTKNLNGVSFADTGTGTAVGYNGTILRTSNGGTSWTKQSSGTTNTLYGVSFPNDTTGMVVGDSGIILHTTNGGASWTKQLSGTTNSLYAVSFTDDTTGTAVGDSGIILHTTNGGASWTKQSSGTTNTLYGVSFTYANRTTAVGYNGTIVRTTNGGTSWTSQSSKTTNTLYGVCFTDFKTGTAVGDSGTILRTTSGTSWTSQSSKTTNTLYGVCFTDFKTGTAVGDSGTILRTTNGGASWTKQLSGTTNTLYGVTFTDANTGTAVGYNGTILRTNNGGAVTAVKKYISKILPTGFSLMQNYPNPFNPSTTISFGIPKPSHVKLVVYDILGRGVATLVDEQKNAGEYKVTFDGSRFASGVYFYKLVASPVEPMTAGTYISVRKLVLMK